MEHREAWKRIPGANIDEEALLDSGSVKIRYKDRAIRCISALDGGEKVNIEVQYSNGNRLFWSTTNINVTFSMLWGIPLSYDCMHIFAPQVNGGVCCISVEDGSIMWKTKSRAHFKQIMVNKTGSICCASGEHDIVVLNSVTGAEIVKKRISVNNHFTVLGNSSVLVEATSTTWNILNSETLETIEILKKNELNSSNGREIWKRVFREWESGNNYNED